MCRLDAQLATELDATQAELQDARQRLVDKELAHSELRTQAEQALSQQVEREAQLAAEQATQNQRDAAAWQNGAAAAMKEGYESAATEIVSLRLQLEQADEEKASLSRKLASQRILTQSLSREGKPCPCTLRHPSETDTALPHPQ